MSDISIHNTLYYKHLQTPKKNMSDNASKLLSKRFRRHADKAIICYLERRNRNNS